MNARPFVSATETGSDDATAKAVHLESQDRTSIDSRFLFPRGGKRRPILFADLLLQAGVGSDAAPRTRTRTRRMWHLLPHEAWQRKMIRANSRFHSQCRLSDLADSLGADNRTIVETRVGRECALIHR